MIWAMFAGAFIFLFGMLCGMSLMIGIKNAQMQGSNEDG